MVTWSTCFRSNDGAPKWPAHDGFSEAAASRTSGDGAVLRGETVLAAEECRGAFADVHAGAPTSRGSTLTLGLSGRRPATTDPDEPEPQTTKS
jgi:hypothetical protein